MLLLPPRLVEPAGPVIFLAGPVSGAPLWQPVAAEQLRRLDPSLWVANPRGSTLEHDPGYDEQITWESHFLPLAESTGCILFWLPVEAEHDCSRAYGQTTRFELGEWMVRGQHLVVGIEDGFSGDFYLRRRLHDSRPDVVQCRTLDATCRAAVALVAHRRKQTQREE